MKTILEINVKITDAAEVRGNTRDVVMLSFTGIAEGERFKGSVIGRGTDTQKIAKDGSCVLSARYMLEGTDDTGEKCRVFIENNSNEDGSLTPSIVTDSKALADWESAELTAEIVPADGGVKVTIRMLE